MKFDKAPARVTFDNEKLPLNMVTWGVPADGVVSISDSKLNLKCIRQKLDDDIHQESFEVVLSDDNYVAFLGERQCSIDCTATCKMHFTPEGQEAAGLALVQAMNHQLQIERVLVDGSQVLRVVLVTCDYDRPPYFPGFTSVVNKEILGSVKWDAEDIVLRIDVKGEDFTIYYGADENSMQELCKADGHLINPEKVGCMTGTLIGMFATGNGEDIDNQAQFEWFEMK